MIAPLLILKFGGTALGTPRRILVAARRLAAWRRLGYRVVAVTSATGGTTDRLIERLAAAGADPREAPTRETDAALATGELLSSALVAAAMGGLGVLARSYSGRAAGLLASGPWGAGRLDGFQESELAAALEHGTVPVVAGFQAGTRAGDRITLGRGASDLSAVFLAARLRARACHIITDVPGVFERDPRECAQAGPIAQLSAQELTRLAESGAEVVQPAAARLAG